MQNKFVDPFTVNLPRIDLHGLDSDMAKLEIEDFINDNYKLGNSNFIILHGIGNGVLIKTTSNTLKNNKRVVQFKRNVNNHGETIVQINLTKR